VRVARRFLTTEARGARRPGQPGRLRHDGRRPDRCSCRAARCGRVVVSVAWVNTRRWSQDERPEKLPVGSGTGGWCPRDDEGRQRSVMWKVKAAPADEARVVRHSRCREAPTLEVLQRGFRGRCESRPPSGAPSTGRSKLARANS